MNPRILEPFLILIFVALTAFIAADMVNTIGKGVMPTSPSFKIPERSKRQGTTVQPEIPAAEDEAIPTVSDTAPPLKLLGTITGAYPYAVVLDAAANKQLLYKLKDDVGSGWLVHDISKNTVVLKKDEKKEVLEVKFIEGEPKQTDGKSAAAKTGIRLDPRDVEGALSDLNKVMTQARVVPNMVEGKTVGYRIFNIASGSIYTKIGLMNQDVVERVNGVEIKSPDTLYQLFQQIKNESRITLDLNRGGRRESVAIEIR